jgi:uncharacterized protein YxjI
LGFFTKFFRFTKHKTSTPFDIKISDILGAPIIRIKRGISFFRSKIDIFDENKNLIGYFQQKYFAIGGKFEIFNTQDVHLY